MRMLAVLVALVLSAASALAQPYPNKQVRVVVGFAAGGPSDVIGRIVAQKLSEALGQQFYVENVGGAGGNTAAAQVARAAPDGYTIHIVRNAVPARRDSAVILKRCSKHFSRARRNDRLAARINLRGAVN
jgi:tripartite-type tricarboxylate transporter receptor subunit TctC